MKNLEMYGVQEMNTQEMKQTDGGDSLFESITQAIGWVMGVGGSSYLSMHESGLLAYRH